MSAGHNNLAASDPDLNLDVPLAPLAEEFCCPICFSMVQDAMMTQCGHVFCSDCISECLSRKKQCPNCNQPQTKEKLVKNHHADRVVALLQREKELAAKKYFERLIAGGGDGGGGDGGIGDAHMHRAAPRGGGGDRRRTCDARVAHVRLVCNVLGHPRC
mmetsp:Transcript_56390/g.138553  ORF Transcript_56390/g.138553 Transcript_56390/m.138553 type:complete len:159 (-) Transcript_56390:217-693(-)